MGVHNSWNEVLCFALDQYILYIYIHISFMGYAVNRLCAKMQKDFTKHFIHTTRYYLIDGIDYHIDDCKDDRVPQF